MFGISTVMVLLQKNYDWQNEENPGRGGYL